MPISSVQVEPPTPSPSPLSPFEPIDSPMLFLLAASLGDDAAQIERREFKRMAMLAGAIKTEFASCI